ncbi:hypothetical protein AB0E81_29150 [Streptomyces sp. NPDC033538]|uniref:hypothetical protein n=1 Tax=Streptomyces sp. NPDC033538 TaxID=3155367 RepID=UPI0033F10EF7
MPFKPAAISVRERSRALGGPADEPGTLVQGRYRLSQRLHVGTTSTTWRATDESQSQEVTLKLFHSPREGMASGNDDFLADAERLAALDIQGMARVSGYGLHEGRPYLVTDAVDGEDLGQLLNPTPSGVP